MQQQIILGTPPSGVGGDSYRTSFTKVNENFTEVYTILAPFSLPGQSILTREHMSDAINLASSTTVASSTAVKVAYDLAATKLTATANAVSASKLVTSRTLSYTGDATGSTTFDGTSNVSAALTLANSGATAGTYPKVTINAKGLVTSGAALVATDIPALDTSKLTTGTLPVARGGTNLTASVQGGLLYGSSTSANAFTAAGAANQVLKSNGTSAPTWQTLDLTFLPDAFAKKSVKAATTANITLSGTQTIDGIALVANDRVLVKNQTTTSANGIYIVQAAAWTRAPDADTSSELAGAVVNVDSGAVNGGLRFDSDFKTTDTLGTTAITWNRAIDTGMAGSVIGTTLGTAAAGTSDKYAREDHVHPIQTTVSGNAGTATKLATARTISSSGDATWSVSFDGTVNASAALTLVNSGVAAGTYKSVTVDTKGRVTAANEVITGLVTSTTATGTSNLATTNTNTFLNITEQIGAAAASAGTSTQVVGAGTVTVSSDTSGKITITGAQSITGNAATATKLATARTLALSGDVTGSATFDGTANSTITATVVDNSHNHTIANVTNLQTTLDSMSKTQTATLPATAGWYRIATSLVEIARVSGRFEVDWTLTGNHGQVIFNAAIMYGTGIALNQSLYSTFAANGLTKVRIVYHTTYTGNYAYLEVYNSTAAAISLTVTGLGLMGWSLVTPSTVGSIPAGYTSRELTFVDGMSTEGQYVSTVATGTAPISVASTTKVTNLNADLLDGYNTSTDATANTIPVRDGSGDIPGNVLGNSTNVTGTVGIANGGTGAIDADSARTNLGLGDAATKNTGVSNGNVPFINGNGLMGRGYGYGAASVIPGNTDLQTYNYVTGWYGLAGTYTNSPMTGSHTSQMLVSVRTYGAGAGLIFQVWVNSAAEYYIGSSTYTSNGDGSVVPSSAITWRKVITDSDMGLSTPIYPVRAWVNFNGIGTVTVRGSGNVTSVTDNGVGDYTVNFTKALPTANYAPSLTVGGTSITDATRHAVVAGTSSGATLKTTTQLRIQTSASNAATLTDVSEINVIVVC